MGTENEYLLNLSLWILSVKCVLGSNLKIQNPEIQRKFFREEAVAKKGLQEGSIPS